MIGRRSTVILALFGMVVLATPPDPSGWEVPADAVGEATVPAGTSHVTSTQFEEVSAPLEFGALSLGQAKQAGAGTTQAAAPLPFDPLSAEEQRRAVRLALESGAALAQRHQVIGAALYTDKAFLEFDAWPRMAEVWIYDYSNDATVQVLVDLGAMEAVSTRSLPDVHPQLTAGEVRRAAAMSLADDAVLRRLADLGIDAQGLGWTARLWEGPEPVACVEHRCALVALHDGPRFLFDPLVAVDLSAQQVLGLLDPQGRLLRGEVGE